MNAIDLFRALSKEWPEPPLFKHQLFAGNLDRGTVVVHVWVEESKCVGVYIPPDIQALEITEVIQYIREVVRA